MEFKTPIHFNRDKTDVWRKYYTAQSKSGRGIRGFQGDDFQRGNGLFGDLFRKWGLPIIKYLGKKAGLTLLKAGSDAVSGDNFVEALKKQSKAAAKGIASDAADRATRFVQTGKGRKRKRNRISTKPAKRRASRRRTKSKNIFL